MTQKLQENKLKTSRKVQVHSKVQIKTSKKSSFQVNASDSCSRVNPEYDFCEDGVHCCGYAGYSTCCLDGSPPACCPDQYSCWYWQDGKTMCLGPESKGTVTPMFAPTAFRTTSTSTSTTRRPSTSTSAMTTLTTTADLFRNDCKQFTTGGCPSSTNDTGFLGVANSPSPYSCNLLCLDYIDRECNSVVFQPFDLQYPNADGVCELWRYSVEEYHTKCMWHSGSNGDNLNHCNVFESDSSLPCEVDNLY